MARNLRAPAGACLSIRPALRPVRRERLRDRIKGPVQSVGVRQFAHRLVLRDRHRGHALNALWTRGNTIIRRLKLLPSPAETTYGFKIRNGVPRLGPTASCRSTS